MKLFLKSIAFFASFAFLLTACGDDDTTESAGGGSTTSPVVESSTISSALPGNGKIQLVWNVPYDDNITTTRVSWTSTATNYVDCSMKYLSAELTATELDEQLAELGLDDVIFGDDYITLTKTLTLTAGTYTISVESLGSVDLDTEVTTYGSEVVVYDETTYTTHPEVAQIAYDGTNAYITWGEIPADLSKVKIGYYNSSDEFNLSVTSFTLTDLAEGGSVTLAGAVKDSYYTLTSYFLPSVAISEDEYVTLDENDYYRQIPQSETAAAAPTNVSVLPGVGRIKVAWTAPEGTVKSVIALKDASGVAVGSEIELSDSDLLKVGDEENVIYIYGLGLNYDFDASAAGGLTAGTYSVEIYNKYNSDTSESEVISAGADVYTAASYASYVPTPAGEYADNVVVSWSNTSRADLESVTLAYGSKEYITATSDLSGGTEFDFVSGTTSFTYTSTFAPEGGFEALNIVSATQSLTAASSVDIEYNSSGSRYDIYTAKGLKAFADLVNGNSNTCGAMLKNMNNSFGSAATSIDGRINATIDLSDLGADVSWEAISAYTGTFTGGSANGYEIKNLYIRTTSSSQGLFGTINGAQIDRVTLVDPIVKVYDAGTVGALVGYAYSNSEITNCSIINSSGDAEVSINTTYGDGNSILGGLIGRLSASYVYNCHNDGVPVINQSTGTNYTGGAVGHVTGGAADDSSSFIVNCTTSGDVTASGNGVGGFTGYTTGLSYYVGCANTGNVTAGAYVAGMIGYITGELKMAACYNTGDISATGHYTGGVTGRIAANVIDVVSCYNTGAVTTTYSASSSQTQATASVAATGGVTSSSVYTQYLTLYSCYYVYTSASSFDLGIGANIESVFAGVQSNMDDYGVEKLTTGSEFSNKVSLMNETLTAAYGTGGVLNGYATSSEYGALTKYGFVSNVDTPYNPYIIALTE